MITSLRMKPDVRHEASLGDRWVGTGAGVENQCMTPALACSISECVLLIWAAALTCVFAAPASSQQGAPSAVPVGIVIAERKPISKTLDFVGRVEAINRVEVRARVKGFLEAVLFKEGDLVKEGDPLYRIEKDLFKAAVEQAQGELQSSKAQHELAVKNRARQEELYAKNVSAGMALDEAVGREGEAKG